MEACSESNPCNSTPGCIEVEQSFTRSETSAILYDADVDFIAMHEVDRAKAVLSRIAKDVSVALLPGEHRHDELSP